MTQPALTVAIRQLEEDVGAQLLVRTRGGARLTPFGEAFIRHARLIVHETRRARDEMAQMRGRWEGQVNLAVSPAIALSVLPHALRPFTEKYPQIRVQCVEGTYPGVASALREGDLDFAVTPVRVDDVEADLEVEPLFESPVVIVARRANPLAGARSLRELRCARWAFATPSRGPGAVIEEAFRNAGLTPPKPAMICESLLALPEVVAHSDHLATLPVAVLERVRCSDELQVVQVREPIPMLRIAVLRKESVPLTPAAQELIAWVRHAAQAAAPGKARGKSQPQPRPQRTGRTTPRSN